MASVRDQLQLLAPALAFLLAAVPSARLLGDLGFFDAIARRVAHRVDGIWPWWLLAAATLAQPMKRPTAKRPMSAYAVTTQTMPSTKSAPLRHHVGRRPSRDAYAG